MRGRIMTSTFYHFVTKKSTGSSLCQLLGEMVRNHRIQPNSGAFMPCFGPNWVSFLNDSPYAPLPARPLA